MISKHKGFIYLATPYAKYEEGKEAAALHATQIANIMMCNGVNVFCPITYGFAILDMPNHITPEHFIAFDLEMLSKARMLIIAMMRGFRESKGIAMEIAYAVEHNIPYIYMHPEPQYVEETAAQVVQLLNHHIS